MKAIKAIALFFVSAMTAIGGTICCWQEGSPVVGLACLACAVLNIPRTVQAFKEIEP